MGSESYGVVGVTVKELEARESDRASIIVSPKMDSGSSLTGQKEVAVWNKMADGELCKRPNQVSGFHVEEVSKDLTIGSTSNHLLFAGPEAKQQQRKSGNVSKSNSGGSKRSRMAQLEVCINETEANEIKGMVKEAGLSPAKCIVAERTQTPKQKTSLNGKRGDKRNGKAPKGKCDFFSVKGGLASFSSAAGGNNILGVYGSRPDMEDVTKHVDELSLNELLDGSYKCPSFAKDKGKKSANLNANILHSIREACSILQRRKIKPQIVEIDGGYYREIHPCPLTSGSSMASRSGGDKGGTNMTDLSSCHKVQDSESKLKIPANILDFPLYQPKDILERLTLPPHKDLEFLLLDASKPVVASRNSADLRLGKPVAHRGCLPSFSWSHASAGHCKSNPDAVKLFTSRTTCQGRWVKIENPISSLGTTSCFLAELESLTYDHSLVPLECQKLVLSRNEKVPLTSVSFLSSEQGLSSSATLPEDPQVSPGGHSPRLLAAAQTLCDMATHSLQKNPYGMMRWPKKPSQKSMRAQNFKPNEKSENMFATPKSKVGSDSLVDTLVEMMPSKKLRLSVNEKSADLVHNNTTVQGPIHWSMPLSSRSSPSKSFRDSVAETKHYNENIVKKPCMKPPAARILDTACSSQPKPRKLMRME